MGYQKRNFRSYKNKQVQEPDIKVKKAPKCDIHSAAPCFSGDADYARIAVRLKIHQNLKN